jgi:hypothetical protein
LPLPSPWDKLSGHESPFVNVKGRKGDENCFIYAVMGAFHGMKSTSAKSYLLEDAPHIVWPSYMTVPVRLTEKLLADMEDMNPSMAISVVILDPRPLEGRSGLDLADNEFHNTCYVFRRSARRDNVGVVDCWIAYYEDAVVDNRGVGAQIDMPVGSVTPSGSGHYVAVKNLSALLNRATRPIMTKRPCKTKARICTNCMNTFYSQRFYDDHRHFCTGGGPLCELPKPMRSETSSMVKAPRLVYKAARADDKPKTKIVAFFDFEAFNIPRKSPTYRGKGTAILADQYPSAWCIRAYDTDTMDCVFRCDFPRHDTEGSRGKRRADSPLTRNFRPSDPWYLLGLRLLRRRKGSLRLRCTRSLRRGEAVFEGHDVSEAVGPQSDRRRWRSLGGGGRRQRRACR